MRGAQNGAELEALKTGWVLSGNRSKQRCAREVAEIYTAVTECEAIWIWHLLLMLSLTNVLLPTIEFSWLWAERVLTYHEWSREWKTQKSMFMRSSKTATYAHLAALELDWRTFLHVTIFCCVVDINAHFSDVNFRHYLRCTNCF